MACAWCLLTNDVLPDRTVIGGHLFKEEWHQHAHRLGLAEVNDACNGLPLWKPLHWAFNTSRLCFIYSTEQQQFIAHVLDPCIMSTRLADKGSALMGPSWRTPPAYLQGLTFKDVHLSPLVFAPKSVTPGGLGLLNSRLGPTPSLACASLLAQVWCPT